MWTVFPGRIVLAQAISINKDDDAQDVAIIHSRSAVAFWGKKLQTLHLVGRQPVEVAHFQPLHKA